VKIAYEPLQKSLTGGHIQYLCRNQKCQQVCLKYGIPKHIHFNRLTSVKLVFISILIKYSFNSTVASCNIIQKLKIVERETSYLDNIDIS